MSIDTLLEAARYLEWQAQQQQIARDEEHRREEELLSREESRRMEVAATLSAQPIRANHVVWGDGHHRQQLQLPQQQQQQQQQPRHPSPAPPVPPPPPPSLPPSHVPITVIPMVPVVTATPSVPPLPITAPMAVATAVHKNGHASSPPQQPAPRHLLCAPQVKVEPVSPPLMMTGDVKPMLPMQPQVQIPYASPIAAAAPGSQHALLPQQAPPTGAPQPRTNGLTVEDMRSLDGKRRPGGSVCVAGTREVHNKLEKNRRAHLKECFETLKKNVPNVDEKKTSNLSVLRSALRYIQTLKRKEKEYEHEMERLAREKIATQQRLAELKKELSQCMDITEIDRVLRQTVQPEDDQASTSTASEGEDNFDQDIEEDVSSAPRPPSLPKPIAPLLQAPPLLAPHLSIQHAALPLSGVLTTPSPTGPSAPQPIAPAPPAPPPASTVTLAPPPAMQVQPTVIAHHAAVSHASVIQAVNHALPVNHKHLTHIAPSPGPTSSSSSVVVPQAMVAAPAPTPLTVTPATHHHPITAQPIGHITVHPVTHLGGPLPPHLSTALYPQGVTMSQPTMVGHITHTFTHLPHVHATHAATQMNAAAAVMSQGGQSLGKPTAVLAPHPQLVGQTTVLNPVTMVTVPPFPVSTLKLA